MLDSKKEKNENGKALSHKYVLQYDSKETLTKNLTNLPCQLNNSNSNNHYNNAEKKFNLIQSIQLIICKTNS